MSFERVRQAAAREFLVTGGLPSSASGLFTAAESEGSEPERIGGRDVVRIGNDGEGDGGYFVDCATGAVLYVAAYAFTEFHVSESPQSFVRCLEEFERATSGAPRDADPDEWTRIAESLERTIAATDPSALREDPGFWHSLLFDVASGDYA
ncbi:SUKH-4 family immunity protein [Streptomyces sp. NBC_00582]|uniref:SUKH-4 family immunity protein n=1 Tax=Streptomyces sp. NBC_00582 TaxID=2975783 RepID=UPI002E809577|nr:SUKH-4 family immunity protein [Streptomyces sp. NBC_00582]WUB62794.1 SUKH-4 family immunity protein [Streptomyces sp. NBC_00582]